MCRGFSWKIVQGSMWLGSSVRKFKSRCVRQQGQGPGYFQIINWQPNSFPRYKNSCFLLTILAMDVRIHISADHFKLRRSRVSLRKRHGSAKGRLPTWDEL